MADILEEWGQIACKAIDAAEERKAAALATLDPEDHDEAIQRELFEDKDCRCQLVPVPGKTAAKILAATPVRGDKYEALCKGLKGSAGAKVILWQACDICHVCGHEHGGGKDDDDE